jgi:hypothetical protein
MPEGTNRLEPGPDKTTRPKAGIPPEQTIWSAVPAWPPDLFAVTAAIINQAGLYSLPRFTTQADPDYVFTQERLDQIKDLGERWGRFPDRHNPQQRQEFKAGDLKELSRLWLCLLNGTGIDDRTHAGRAWQNAAIELMVIADTASRGMGFISKIKPFRPFAELVVDEHIAYLDKGPDRQSPELPHIPYSICKMVHPSEVCVQPKTRTPQTGCTLRSFSHHLALLPPALEVATTWSLPQGLERSGQQEELRPLNLLLVPFPFHVTASCFVPRGHVYGEPGTLENEPLKKRQRFFGVNQEWLTKWEKNGRRRRKVKVTGEDLEELLVPLIDEARKETSDLDGLILPELALDHALAEELKELLYRDKRLQFFVSGIHDARDGIRNSVFGSLFAHSQGKSYQWTQSKHHRWKLDDHQICRYHLGERLYPKEDWWEEINIEQRACAFWVYRHGASLVTLVCEDLARIDPVQEVIRAVGPNLVITLLMDGPQKEERWSARYATVLADDPGSAVLALTSRGLMKRSVMPGDQEPSEIALWKGGEGKIRLLKLPRDSHALLVTLSTASETHFTLDGRSDEGNTSSLYLSAVHAIKHPNLPEWAC